TDTLRRIGTRGLHERLILPARKAGVFLRARDKAKPYLSERPRSGRVRRDELVRADHASRKKHSSGEIERALKRKLPNLVTDDDLRGILHCHTDASDGTETLETMAKARRDRGFEYFGVADH